MIDHCEHVGELVNAELEIIKRHLGEHKWFRHILDDNDAIMSFNEDYGWLMREMYCGYVCKDRDDCTLAERYKK